DHREAERDCEADPPLPPGRPRQHDGADLVRDRTERVPGADQSRTGGTGMLFGGQFRVGRHCGREPRVFCSWPLRGRLSEASYRGGFGFRTGAKYVNRGRVFKSVSTPKCRGFCFWAATRLRTSFMSPKTIACVGHAAWQAVTI